MARKDYIGRDRSTVRENFKRHRMPPPISTQEAANALAQLAEVHDDRNAELNQYAANRDPVESDDENDSPTPIFDAFYNSGGSATILAMTNFTPQEFERCWDIIADFVRTNWNVGRGRRCAHSGRDVFFMLLTVMKHGGNWDFLAEMFKMKGPTFERMIVKFLETISQKYYDDCMREVLKRYTMESMVDRQKTFKNYPYCRYAVDVTFQQSNRPSGTMEEGKLYYSGKHKLYGLKVEVAVLPNGMACWASKHYGGSVADIEIFHRNKAQHFKMLRKTEAEEGLMDGGQFAEDYPTLWAVLCDKGYQGLLELLRAIHPKRKPVRGTLSRDDVKQNFKKSSDRIIVENFFGRLCQLWTVLSNKYRWKESMYDHIMRFGIALTNCHIKWHPLRAADVAFFNSYRTRLYTIGDDIQNKRRRVQEKYRRNRRRRLSAQRRSDSPAGSHDDDHDCTLPPPASPEI